MRFLDSKQSGIAALAIIAVVVIVGAIGGVGYYVYSQNSSDSSSDRSLSQAEQKAIEAECTKEIDDKDFCKFASNFTLDGNYRMNVQSFGENEGTFLLELDSQGNSSIKAQSPEGNYEFVQFNNATYSREDGSETWIKFPQSPETESITSGVDELTFDETDFADLDTSEYVNEGKEACGNLTCFKYRIIDSASPELVQYLYFDDKEYKLRKFSSIENGQLTAEGTLEYVNVVISEPTPFEEFDASEFNLDSLQNIDTNNL
jgi:hypothetical protein